MDSEAVAPHGRSLSGRIDERTHLDRDAIVAAVDLAALADGLLGPRLGSGTSPVWPCPSPDHDAASEAPASVSVFRTRRGEQRWHCPNCGDDGSAIDLVMRTRRVGFREALEHLAERTGSSAASLPDAPPQTRGAAGMSRQAPRTGLDAWVAHSSRLLWELYGEPVRHWLTNERRLPDAVLRLHEIGATGITPDDQSVDGVFEGPRSADRAAVLPVAAKGRSVHAELRRIDARGDPRVRLSVLQPSGPRPSLGLYRPPQRLHPEILITNSIMDALSANAAGYRAAALLAPGHADAEAETAVFLSRLQGPLVIAMKPNRPDEPDIDCLANHLRARGRRPALVAELTHGLNDYLAAANNWPRQLAAHVRHAVASAPPDRVPEI